MNRRFAVAGAAALLFAFATARLQERPGRMLDAALHHLGNDRTPDWKEAPVEPEGTRLEVRFESGANEREWTLYLRQRSIDNVWRLMLNGAEVAQLRRGAELVERWYALPAGSVKAGMNVLAILPDTPTDDVVIGDLRLVELPVREIYSLAPVRVRVRDAATNSAVPARVTFVDAAGQRPPVFFADDPRVAARDGVLYVSDSEALVELPAGEYTSYATRGSEWSLSAAALSVRLGATAQLEHVLRREVDTAGFVACDTHLHTLQFSGHGDASALERQVTLAGEGVELAIATDHNHNIDYVPFQRQLGLTRWFTALVGNEVTTEIGHFNAFPLDSAAPIPPHRSRDIVTIIDGIRARGATVVILNHPRWPSASDSPFGHHHLDHLLGRFDPPLELPVDATELINSTTEEPDALALFRDWFALLNRGVRIFAVGSSDSHTVGEPVGQGRTYVASATDDPAAIDVDAACAAIREGRTSIGQGLFATALVDARPAMGLTFDRSAELTPFEFELRVQAPSWIRPTRATVYVNGSAETRRKLECALGEPLDASLRFELPLATRNDAWIVCVVEGEPVSTPAWPALNAYTLAATNPMFIDRDGGGYTSPGAAAAAFAPKATDEELRVRLAEVDIAHAVQLLAAWAAEQRSNGASGDELVRRARAALGERAPHEESLAALLARW